MNERIAAAVAQLKEFKAQGSTYHQASQKLGDRGFTPEEIAQAAYQFPYSADAAEKAAAPSSHLDHTFAKAVVHQEAIDSTKKDLHKHAAAGIIFGGLVGRYFSAKAISDYAALKDLRAQSVTGEPPPAKPGGNKLLHRNRAVRYFAVWSLVPLIVALPVFFISARQFSVQAARGVSSLNDALLFLWPVVAAGAFVATVALLFLAKKEATLLRGVRLIMGLELVFFAVSAVLLRSPLILALGLVVLLPEYWISRRVGVLSHLD